MYQQEPNEWLKNQKSPPTPDHCQHFRCVSVWWWYYDQLVRDTPRFIHDFQPPRGLTGNQPHRILTIGITIGNKIPVNKAKIILVRIYQGTKLLCLVSRVAPNVESGFSHFFRKKNRNIFRFFLTGIFGIGTCSTCFGWFLPVFYSYFSAYS